MFMHNNGQASLESAIIIGVICLITFFVISFLTSTFDTTIVIYDVKYRTLELLSDTDDLLLLSSIDYLSIDNNISLILTLKQINTSAIPLTTEDYNSTIGVLSDITRFDNISISFNYV